MTTKKLATTKKPPSRGPAPRTEDESYGAISQLPPATPQDRRERIQAMGQRIAGYIRFMCQHGGSGGTSPEARERALAAFYDRMVVVERQLGKIQEEFQLE